MERPNKQLDELTSAVNALTQRLEKSERQSRFYRFLFAIVVLVVFLGGVASAQLPMNDDGKPQDTHPAAGQSGAGHPPMNDEQLKAAMMQMMQSAVIRSVQLSKENPNMLRGEDVQAMVDTAQLLAIYSIISNTDSIETLMKEANQALKAVPHMAAEMQRMNHSMGIMSYSIGQTMGKMGSWNPLPWGPE